MAQDQFLVVYSGMEDAAKLYDQKAQELRALCKKISDRNDQLVSSEWNAETAVRFQARFREDHARAIETVAQALEDIAKYIRAYVADNRNKDVSGASRL